MTKTIVLITAALLSSSGAVAQSPVVVTGDPAPFKIVNYDDLNLSSKAGRDRLTHRIRAAADDLCFEGNKEEVELAMARKSCYRTAVNGGLSQMNAAIAARQSGATLAAATLVIRGR